MAVMFPPPPADDDLMSDLEPGRWHTVQAAGLTLQARAPLPRALAVLRAATTADRDQQTRQDFTGRFLRDHLSEQSHAELYRALVDPEAEASPDTLEEVMRAVATLGTSRPFRAVVGLAASAAVNWRMVRARLALGGVTDPLSAFPTLHTLLDVMESMLVENADERQRNEVYTSLYRPEPGQTFDTSDTDDAFDAFADATRGLK